jgi:hypothetical protein
MGLKRPSRLRFIRPFNAAPGPLGRLEIRDVRQDVDGAPALLGGLRDHVVEASSDGVQAEFGQTLGQ